MANMSLKREYNGILKRVKDYCNLDANMQETHRKAFMGLIDRLDAIILELGFDNCNRQELLYGFKGV